jgi:SAM-dependent methyltransferase
MSTGDIPTIQAYDTRSAAYADRFERIVPMALYRWARTFFHAGAPTADIGCGSGRDVVWLQSQGFPTTGYDASTAMLDEARRRHPGIAVKQDSLPELASIADASVANIWCCAVLMHLPADDLITAALNLARILRDDGRIIVSYRASATGSEREADGRLFTDMPSGKLTLLLEAAGLRVLLLDTQVDATRPDITWHALVAERAPLDVAGGLQRIQGVLAQDVKFATDSEGESE